MKKIIAAFLVFILVIIPALGDSADHYEYSPKNTNGMDLSTNEWLESEERRALLTVLIAIDFEVQVEDGFFPALTKETYIGKDDNNDIYIGYQDLEKDDCMVVQYRPSKGQACAYMFPHVIDTSLVKNSIWSIAPRVHYENDKELVRAVFNRVAGIVDTEYDYAFARYGDQYSVYYVFDTQNGIVRSFATNDYGVMAGTFTGKLEKGVTISWTKDWEEQFQIKSNGKAVLVDVDGFAFEFETCDVSEAVEILNQDGYEDMILE